MEEEEGAKGGDGGGRSAGTGKGQGGERGEELGKVKLNLKKWKKEEEGNN